MLIDKDMVHECDYFGFQKHKHTCKFSLCLKLLMTEKFLCASLEFLKRGARNGSRFCRNWIKNGVSFNKMLVSSYGISNKSDSKHLPGV